MINSDENKIVWIEKVKLIMTMGGKSDGTFNNYLSHINRFLNNFNMTTNFINVQEEDILFYIKKNYIDLDKSSSTINVAISSICFLYSVCFKIDLNRKLLPNAKLIKKIPTIISKEDFIKIFNRENNTKHRCYLLLAFCSGLRASEIASIRIENINSSEHKIKVLGKGKKERYSVLPDITIKFLRLYCKEYHITEKQGYLFKNNKDKCVSRQSVSDYFNIRVQKKYNLPNGITFHSLRHSFATYFLINGGDLIVLQSLLGHTSIMTTRRYIHFSKNYNHLEGIKYVN